MITLTRTDNTNPDFIPLVEKLNKDLWERYGLEQGTIRYKTQVSTLLLSCVLHLIPL